MPAPLIFVYNADSGVLNGLKDLWAKTVHLETYPCSLCAVTYGPLGMRREWREYVRALGHEVRFLHRDEWQAEFGLVDMPLPAAFRVGPGGVPQAWISPAELGQVRTLEELTQLVTARLEGGEPGRHF